MCENILREQNVKNIYKFNENYVSMGILGFKFALVLGSQALPRLAVGCAQPCWESLQCHRPLSGFKGTVSREGRRLGQGRAGCGRWGVKEGRGKGPSYPPSAHAQASVSHFEHRKMYHLLLFVLSDFPHSVFHRCVV